MFHLKGILKKEELKEFTKKDGTKGISKTLFVEPAGSVYPIKVNVANADLKVGKEGEQISIEVEAYPYYFEDKKRKRAFLDVYIPNKK